MYIPLKIEIGCMVYVIIPSKVNNKHFKTFEKWCEVTNIFLNDVGVFEDNSHHIIPLYLIKFFTFGGIVIINPDFDIGKALKKK